MCRGECADPVKSEEVTLTVCSARSFVGMLVYAIATEALSESFSENATEGPLGAAVFCLCRGMVDQW
jgi:hypothetical protein